MPTAAVTATTAATAFDLSCNIMMDSMNNKEHIPRDKVEHIEISKATCVYIKLIKYIQMSVAAFFLG